VRENMCLKAPGKPTYIHRVCGGSSRLDGHTFLVIKTLAVGHPYLSADAATSPAEGLHGLDPRLPSAALRAHPECAVGVAPLVVSRLRLANELDGARLTETLDEDGSFVAKRLSNGSWRALDRAK
jgi:hypothetical protein